MAESASSSRPVQSQRVYGLPASVSAGNSHQVIGNGRYRVLQLHATGGMARVYRALDTQLNREVAIKLLAPEFTHDSVRVERFRLEARRVAALRHPQIVPLLGYGEEDHMLYLVMPFYQQTLRDALQNRRTFPLSDVVAVTSQVAAALDYAHGCGIIHRDVKPENILLHGEGGVLLGDFGIAKADATAPRTLATGGPLAAAEAGRARIASLEYTAPEYLMGKPVDRCADVYGLGIVVYEMLTGRVPFPLVGDEVSRVMMRMLTEQATPPSMLAPASLPLTVDAIVLAALERDPRRRYASPGEFSRDLKQTLMVPVGTIPFYYPSTRPAVEPRPRQFTTVASFASPPPRRSLFRFLRRR